VRQMRNCVAMGAKHVIKVNLLRRDERSRQNRGWVAIGVGVGTLTLEPTAHASMGSH
jgi:hypothetical protein